MFDLYTKVVIRLALTFLLFGLVILYFVLQ